MLPVKKTTKKYVYVYLFYKVSPKTIKKMENITTGKSLLLFIKI